MKFLCLLVSSLVWSMAEASALPVCADEALVQSRALIRFHDPVLASMPDSEKQLRIDAPVDEGLMSSPSDPGLRYSVLELEVVTWGTRADIAYV